MEVLERAHFPPYDPGRAGRNGPRPLRNDGVSMSEPRGTGQTAKNGLPAEERSVPHLFYGAWFTGSALVRSKFHAFL